MENNVDMELPAANSVVAPIQTQSASEHTEAISSISRWAKNKTLITVIGVLLVVAFFIIIFLLKNSKNPSSATEYWNSDTQYDKTMFTGQRYMSGDVYLGSCFESEVPKEFEITTIGVLPRIGVVKPLGPKVEDVYFPYIDIRFHENPNKDADLLTENNYPSLKPWIISLIGSQATNLKPSFGYVKLYDRVSRAIIVEYENHYAQSVIYNGRSVQDTSGINVFVVGGNSPQILENFKLEYEQVNKDRDIKMFKEFLKTFKPTCFAE